MIKKPIPLPHWGMLIAIHRNNEDRPKWKVTPAIKEQYRVGADIMLYDWKYTFYFKLRHNALTNPSVTIFYSNAYDSYQVAYSYRGTTLVTLMVAYENMNPVFMSRLLSNIVPVKDPADAKENI